MCSGNSAVKSRTSGRRLRRRRCAADGGAGGLVLALEHVGVKVSDAVLLAHVVGHDSRVLERLARRKLRSTTFDADKINRAHLIL